MTSSPTTRGRPRRRCSSDVTTGRLSAGQVQAIVHLVASSIEGLSPENVTRGRLDGPCARAPGRSSQASGDWRVEQQREFEDGMARSIEEMLFRVTGGGRPWSRSTPTWSSTPCRAVTESFAKPDEATALVEKSTKETYKGKRGRRRRRARPERCVPPRVPPRGPTRPPPTPHRRRPRRPMPPTRARPGTSTRVTTSSASTRRHNKVDREGRHGRPARSSASRSPVPARPQVQADQARLTALVAAAAGIVEGARRTCSRSGSSRSTPRTPRRGGAAEGVTGAQKAAEQSGMIRTALVAWSCSPRSAWPGSQRPQVGAGVQRSRSTSSRSWSSSPSSRSRNPSRCSSSTPRRPSAAPADKVAT